MRWHHRLHVALRGWFGSARLDRELGDELQFHFNRQVEANIERGMDASEAQRAAAITSQQPAHTPNQIQVPSAWAIMML